MGIQTTSTLIFQATTYGDVTNKHAGKIAIQWVIIMGMPSGGETPAVNGIFPWEYHA